MKKREKSTIARTAVRVARGEQSIRSAMKTLDMVINLSYRKVKVTKKAILEELRKCVARERKILAVRTSPLHVSYRSKQVTRTVHYIYLNGESFSLMSLMRLFDDIDRGTVVEDDECGQKLLDFGILGGLGSQRSMYSASKGPRFKQVKKLVTERYEKITNAED